MIARRSGVLAFVLSLAGAASAAGCGTEPATTSVVCTDFRAGADLSSSTFGVTGDLQRPYVAFAQAAGDLASVANRMLRDVGAACQSLAVELGASDRDPRVVGRAEPEAVRGWCDIAAERFSIAKASLVAGGAVFSIQVVVPKCSADATFQTACESKCRVDAACVESSAEDRCPVEAREGICGATCLGTCTGSETAPAACATKCNGTCFGSCGTGKDAIDCSAGCACAAPCTGSCTASCEAQRGGGSCNAVCSGGCTKPMLAQTCTQPLAAPKCAGDVDCQKSCAASGAARALCPSGSLAVTVDPASRRDARWVQLVGVLDRNLPAIFLAARGRAQVLSDGASDLVGTAGNILKRSDDLGPMGAACGMLIGQTSSEARKNLDAALGGSKVVAHAVAGDAPAAAQHASTDDD